MGLQSSIFQRKDHAHALSVVDIVVETTDFPTTVRCPICGELSLNVYEDTIKTDLWLACTNCPAHGNIITFASAYWKIDTLATIAKFKELGVNTRELSDANLNAALKYAKTDSAADWFWQQAASQLWTHGNDLLLLKFRDFGLSQEIPCEGLAGVAWPDQVADLCKNITPGYPRKLRNKTPILVLPYCDLPRHHSGFLLLQYLEEFEMRRMFLPMRRYGHDAQPPDAGYYLLEQAALAKNPAVRDSVFIVEDPQWVLKAQTIQLRHGDNLLPICASYSGREAASNGSSWPQISLSKKFFYNARIVPDLVSQAANARGYICALRADGLPKPVQPAKTIKTLGQLYRAAVTWPKTLVKVFEQTNDTAAKSFASRLSIPTEKLRQFFTNNPVASADAVEQILAQVTPMYFSSTEVTDYATNIIVRDDNWYTFKNTLITNCAPVIEKIIYTDTKKYYIGHVKKKGQRFEFTAPATTLDRVGLLAYVERLMAAKNEHVFYTSMWNRRSQLLAMTIRPPEIIHTRSKPGWDDATREFYCADYAINCDGAIRTLPHAELSQSKFRLPAPGTFAPPSLHKLFTPTAENAAIWAIVSAVIANSVASACERDPQSTCITGELFLAAREIMQAMHIEHKEVRMFAQRLSKSFASKIKDVSWPKLVSSPYTTDRFSELALVRYPNTAAFIRINAGTITAALSHGWQVLHAPAITPGNDYSALPYVIAAYIQHIIKHRVRFFRSAAKNLTQAILGDLHAWLTATYGDTFNLTSAETYIHAPGAEITHLMREINNAILAGEIDVLPAFRKQRQKNNYIVRNGSTWWLNRKAIDDYFKQISGVTPNWMAISDCFSRLGLLRGEKTMHKTTGLLVDSDWCDKFWTNYKDSKKKNIG